MTQQLIINYCWSKCENRSLGYFQDKLQNRYVFLLASYQFKNRRSVQSNFNWNTGNLPHHFSRLWQLSHIWSFFSLLGPLYGYIAFERAKCEKGQNFPSPLCMLYMLCFKRKWYSLSLLFLLQNEMLFINWD